jgi:ribonuclease P protein component
MLSKRERISRSQFAEIMKSRQFANSPHFTLRSVSVGNIAKFAVSVSKKVSKKAVVRNRIRRRAYSALPKASPGLHLLIAKPGAEQVKGEVLRDELALLFKKR